MRFKNEPLTYIPVAVSHLAAGVHLGQFPGQLRTVEQTSPDVLAQLVECRLRLERAKGWGIFGAFAMAFTGVFLLCGHVRSDLVLGVYAAAMASMAGGVATAVERVLWRIFLRQGREQGLTDEAVHVVYEHGLSAGHWLDVLRACGVEPSPSALAAIIRGEGSEGSGPAEAEGG